MVLYRLDNVVQPYAWGSRTAIADLLGRAPTEAPEAELWMGAHPKAPSVAIAVDDPDDSEALDTRLEAAPETHLGPRIAQRFGGGLPFLFKVLAAEQPLSLQAHPSLQQARTGFTREQSQGIPLDAPHRNYRDDNHKPELIVALTPFTALCGFRRAEEAIAILEHLDIEGGEPVIEALRTHPNADGMRQAFASLFEWSEPERVVSSVVAGARRLESEGVRGVSGGFRQRLELAARWTVRIAELYPRDVGVVGALLLNLVELAPGEGIYLPAGNLHAYLGGVGLELMANSDNVLRGGLTPKHVDRDELLSVLSFLPHLPPLVHGEVAEHGSARERVYRTPAQEFELSTVDLFDHGEIVSRAGPEICLCLHGEVTLSRGESELVLRRGSSAFVSFEGGSYTLRGRGRLARARVPVRGAEPVG